MMIKGLVAIALLALIYNEAEAAVAREVVELGKPVELSLGTGRTTDGQPMDWRRKRSGSQVEETLNDQGQWTDGDGNTFGSKASVLDNNKLKFEKFTEADAGDYYAPNQKVPNSVAKTLLTVGVVQLNQD